MNKYVKWFLNNTEYSILFVGVINLLKFTIVGLIMGIISIVVFLLVRKRMKKINEKFKIK